MPLITSGRLSLSPRCQIARQHDFQRLIGADEHVVDSLLAAALLEAVRELLQLVEIGPSQGPRLGQQFRQALQAAEEHHLVERKIDLGRIEHVKEYYFVAAVAKVPQPGEQ